MFALKTDYTIFRQKLKRSVKDRGRVKLKTYFMHKYNIRITEEKTNIVIIFLEPVCMLIIQLLNKRPNNALLTINWLSDGTHE